MMLNLNHCINKKATTSLLKKIYVNAASSSRKAPGTGCHRCPRAPQSCFLKYAHKEPGSSWANTLFSSFFYPLPRWQERGSKGRLFAGSLITIKIKDPPFSKNNYASAGTRDWVSVSQNITWVLGWFWLLISLSISKFFLFSGMWT